MTEIKRQKGRWIRSILQGSGTHHEVMSCSLEDKDLVENVYCNSSSRVNHKIYNNTERKCNIECLVKTTRQKGI